MRRDRSSSATRRPWTTALVVALALSVGAAALPQRAEAQVSTVRPDGKGILGLGLVGAELGLIIPALAGVRDEWWPYLVFPLLGAAGGAVGGWAVEQNTQNDAEVDVALMVVGLALVVPTIVGTLALTAYQPPDAAEEWFTTGLGLALPPKTSPSDFIMCVLFGAWSWGFGVGAYLWTRALDRQQQRLTDTHTLALPQKKTSGTWRMWILIRRTSTGTGPSAPSTTSSG